MVPAVAAMNFSAPSSRARAMPDQLQVVGLEVQAVADAELAAGLPGGGDHLLALRGRHRHRLLAVDVLAGARGADACIRRASSSAARRRRRRRRGCRRCDRRSRSCRCCARRRRFRRRPGLALSAWPETSAARRATFVARSAGMSCFCVSLPMPTSAKPMRRVGAAATGAAENACRPGRARTPAAAPMPVSSARREEPGARSLMAASLSPGPRDPPAGRRAHHRDEPSGQMCSSLRGCNNSSTVS